MSGPQIQSSSVNHQHYVPEFYLRRFASDAQRKKIMTFTRRNLRIVEEERSIKYSCAKKRIYRDREDRISRLENIVQRSAIWTPGVAGRHERMSESDARDLYRAVSHFSVRTPLSKSFLVDWNERGVDLTNLGSNLDDIFEKMATAYEEWDKMFHLTSVRLLYTKNELLTSAFPTSSFEEGMDIDGVTFPYHVTMAIDRHLLAHVMVRSFDPNERVKQHFWITSAEDQIVLRHNMAQIARFASSEDVEYLVNLGSSSTDLIDRTLSALGWNLIVGRGGRRTFVRS